MKILFCCENYYPSVGGVQEVIRQIAERLAAKGHEITVATSRHPQRTSVQTINSVTVRSFDISGNLARGMHGNLAEYQSFILDGGFDALIVKAAQQWTFDAMIPILNRINSRKVFIPCGFSGLYLPPYRDYYRRMPAWLGKFDKLIFYAHSYRDIDFARELGLSNYQVIPNGADEREFASTADDAYRNEIGVDVNDLLLLTVGTLNGAKGHWEVAKAFESAHFNRPATLILNGTQPATSWLRRLSRLALDCLRFRMPLEWLVFRINRRQSPAKRVWLTDLPRQELLRAYKAADLFVFASYVEYSPLVLFESVAAGTPFLSTPVGNAAEIAAWTSGGRVTDTPADAQGYVRVSPKKLVDSLQDMCADGDLLRRTGEAGRKAFLEHGYSWAVIADLYERILKGEDL